MKVVFLLTQDRGGPADLTTSLAVELACRANSPEVIILAPASVSGAGLPRSLLLPVHVQSKADVGGYLAVSDLLKELSPDIVHAQDRRAGLVSTLVANRKTPIVLTFHGVPDNAAGRWVQAGPLRGRRPGLAGGSRLVADALVSRAVTCTVAPSAAMAGFLRRELHVPARQLRVLPNGVAIPADRHPTAAAVRTFATASSFSSCKATPVLVRAFLAAAEHRPDLRLLMIGDGDDRRLCEDLVRRSRQDHQVEFAGYRTDVVAQLERADAFVLPSVNENMPLALLQAMAAGMPCIAASIGGIPEALGGCGVLVAPGDVRSLRHAMEQLITDPMLAGELGAAARRRAAETFSLARCADGHVRLWSEILARERG
jgi:glycosyltransferase involved in cell wall biosynthesis